MNIGVLGRAGEDFVAAAIRKQGFIISARNFISRFGEIDIIAENNTHILFVEVKTRSAGAIGAPREAVDRRKRQRILATAQVYMLQNAVALQPRFDVAEVWQESSTGRLHMHYIKNAFGVEASASV